MRTITILTITVAAILTITLAYNSMWKDAASEQAMTSRTGTSYGLKVQDKLDELSSNLRHYQQTNEEQFKQTRLGQARLNKSLADLDARLRPLETAGVEQTTDASIPHSVEQATDMALSDNLVRDLEPVRVNELELGQWMDETLRTGNWDREATELAIEEVEKRLANLPGVNLEDMQCSSEGFCRATFTHENGKRPNIQNLFGAPPFVNAGFTIHEADGSVSLYSTESGISLEDFRSK